VLAVDDHPLLRAGITSLINAEPGKSERLMSTCINVLADKEQWRRWYDSVEMASRYLVISIAFSRLYCKAKLLRLTEVSPGMSLQRQYTRVDCRTPLYLLCRS
jgi:DNA-binding NarL/FixJ family response regulator